MAKLPENFQESQTVLAIYDAYKKKEQRRFSRRLGASLIGRECPRAIWYSFRWASQEDFDGRKLRLFETGQREESRFVENLKSVGCEVHDRDSATGQQIEYTSVGGHLIDKVDAVILGVPEAPKTWHVGEFKTHNAKSFADLRKQGVRLSKPEHYAQLIVGMALAGLERGLYLAMNKDTDELYAERLRWEQVKPDAEKLLAFAKSIVEATRAPARISEDPDKIPCRWCAFKDLCHGTNAPQPGVPAIVSCRSCCHATPVTDGTLGNWRCERHGKNISEQEQQRACDDHLFIPDFITFAEVVDGAEHSSDTDNAGFVEYKNVADGVTWRNGRSEGNFRSIELTQLPAILVTDPLIDGVKKEFGGVVVGVE